VKYYDGIEDDRYDSWRQRLLDALNEGRKAGELGLAADLCPYYPFDAEYNQWHQGRLETLCQPKRRIA